MKRILVLAALLALVPVATAGDPVVSVTAGSDQACPTNSGSYKVEVHNTGPAADRYDLSVDAPWPRSVTLAEERLTVEPGATADTYLWVKAPQTATTGDHGFTVSARSSNTGETARVSDTLTVLSCRSVDMTARQVADPVCRGDTATYEFRVTNTGQVAETYELSAPVGELSSETVTLNSQETTTVRLTASSDEPVDRTVPVTVESTRSYASDTVEVPFMVEQCRSVDLSVSSPGTMCRGDNATVTATVRNTGSVRDTYTVAVGETRRNVTVAAGDRATVEDEQVVRVGETTVPVTVRSHGFAAVTAERTATFTGEVCHDMALTPRTTGTVGAETNATLLDLVVRNNGTRESTYRLQLDSPDWMDVRPDRITMAPGMERTAHVYIAPDYFGNGTYTAKLVVTSEDRRRTLDIDVTVAGDEVTTRVTGRSSSLTGLVTGGRTGILAVAVMAFLLFVGGYWYFRRMDVSDSVTGAIQRTPDAPTDLLELNARTVTQRLQQDDLDRDQLETLLEEEQQGSARDTVIDEIQRQLDRQAKDS